MDEVQKDIKMVFDNTFIIKQISQDILRHFSFYFDTIGYGIRYMDNNYKELGLDLDDVYFKCSTTQIEGNNAIMF